MRALSAPAVAVLPLLDTAVAVLPLLDTARLGQALLFLEGLGKSAGQPLSTKTHLGVHVSCF